MKNLKEKKRSIIFPLVFLSIFFLPFWIQEAYGLPTLELSSGGEVITSSDPDGEVLFVGTVGNFDIVVTQGFTKPYRGSAAQPELDLFSVQITSLAGMGENDGGTLTIKFSEDGFGPFTGNLVTQVGGITDGTVSFNTYVDASDALFGQGTRIGNINTINGSDSAWVSFISSDEPFSMTSIAEVTHMASDYPLYTSFNLYVAAPVPELETSFLLGICLVSLVGIQWKKKRS
jgi:hypothetical protein